MPRIGKKSVKKEKPAQLGAMKLAGGLLTYRTIRAYAIPYYTLEGSDTEYLISNPNPVAVDVTVAVFGKNCRIQKKLDYTIKRNCTLNIRVRTIAPDQAGFSIVLAKGVELVIHLLYYRSRDMAVSGGELAGRDNLYQWGKEKSRTYAFGYRSRPLGHDTLNGSVYVSAPHSSVLTGTIVFYGQDCKPVPKKRIRIKPGCTERYDFPKQEFGYGLIRVSAQAVINVLHFAASARGIAAAELVGEANRVTVTADPPSPRSKVLFDDTHRCRPGVTGDWTQFETAITGAGYTVAHYTAPTVTLAALQRHDVFVIAIPRVSYSATEKTAIADFVNNGGGLLIVQDFGNAPWCAPTREILNLFGANDDNNVMQDPTNCYNPGQTDDVVFDYQRNFLSHPIVNGWKMFHVDAAASLSGDTSWTTVVETDDDATPPRRPAVIVRAFGSGRIVAFGDSNTWADHLIGNLENEKFGVRCIEWLLFRI